MPSLCRVFVQLTLPTILLGTALLGACVFGLVSLQRLEVDRERILARDVESLQAAQELEVRLRQLRYHGFVYVLQPTDSRHQRVDEDHMQFEQAVRRARAAADQVEAHALLNRIESGYQAYRQEIDERSQWPPEPITVRDSVAWGDAHPVRHLLVLCDELMQLNRRSIEETRRENEALTERTSTWMILLSVGGVVGGLLLGAGSAWRLSRSMTYLRVRLQTAHRELDLGSVRVTGEGPSDDLGRLTTGVVDRVRMVVTQLQEQERELLRREQLAAVGQLAAGLAHEIRNPLTGVKLLIESALRADGGGLSRPELEMTLAEMRRIERIVQGLLDFARSPVPQRHTLDLVPLIRLAVESVKPRADSHRVNVRFEVTREHISCSGDADQLVSLITNLVINAIEATPAGGTITVSVELVGMDRVHVSVSDTGVGIDSAVLERLFTPFVTTKSTGTGLGLSMARRIADAHGGSLTATNLFEGGACFLWTIPTDEVVNAQAADCG